MPSVEVNNIYTRRSRSGQRNWGDYVRRSQERLYTQTPSVPPPLIPSQQDTTIHWETSSTSSSSSTSPPHTPEDDSTIGQQTQYDGDEDLIVPRRIESTPARFRKKSVCILHCRYCDTRLSARAMRAVLLADARVELFSTDLPPHGYV